MLLLLLLLLLDLMEDFENFYYRDKTEELIYNYDKNYESDLDFIHETDLDYEADLGNETYLDLDKAVDSRNVDDSVIEIDKIFVDKEFIDREKSTLKTKVFGTLFISLYLVIFLYLATKIDNQTILNIGEGPYTLQEYYEVKRLLVRQALDEGVFDNNAIGGGGGG